MCIVILKIYSGHVLMYAQNHVWYRSCPFSDVQTLDFSHLWLLLCPVRLALALPPWAQPRGGLQATEQHPECFCQQPGSLLEFVKIAWLTQAFPFAQVASATPLGKMILLSEQ